MSRCVACGAGLPAYGAARARRCASCRAAGRRLCKGCGAPTVARDGRCRRCRFDVRPPPPDLGPVVGRCAACGVVVCAREEFRGPAGQLLCRRDAAPFHVVE